MGRNVVGFIDPTGQNKQVTQTGFISNPFAAALNSFLDNRLCEMAEKAESYYRSIGFEALANLLYANRAAAGCTIAPPGGFVPEVPPPPFEGGQCSGVQYTFRLTIQVSGQNQVSNVFTRFGPLEGYRMGIPPGGNTNNGLFFDHRDSSGNPDSIYLGFAPSGQSFIVQEVSEIARLDGQPDNCGNINDGDPPVYPVEVDLPPAPLPGEEILPPESVIVPIEVDGIPVDVDVPITEVTVDTEEGVCLTILGRRVCVRPDFGITVDDGNDGTKPPTTEEIADELEETINPVIAGSVGAQLCDGTIVDFPYNGNGLEGVADKLGAVVDSLLTVNAEQCPIEETEETLGPIAILASGTVTDLDVINLSIDDLTRRIYIELSLPTAGMRVFRLSGDESEANYGSFSLSYQAAGARYIDDWELFYTRRRFIEFTPKDGLPAFLRLSLKEGLSYTVSTQRIV